MDSKNYGSSIESSRSFTGDCFAGLVISRHITEHEDDDCQLPAPIMCHEDRLAVEMYTDSVPSESSGKNLIQIKRIEKVTN